MEFTTLMENYISISYILAVSFGTDALNKFVPWFKKADNRIAATVVPIVMAVAFYFFENPEDKLVFSEKIFVSFLCAVAGYDFIIKPIRKSRTAALKRIEDENKNEN